MLPDVWVILPQLPVAPNGKVNRKALPEPTGESGTISEYQSPVTALEKALRRFGRMCLSAGSASTITFLKLAVTV